MLRDEVLDMRRGDMCDQASANQLVSTDQALAPYVQSRRQEKGHEKLMVSTGQQTEVGRMCTLCGDEISPKRLKAVPFTQLCLDCKETSEALGKN